MFMEEVFNPVENRASLSEETMAAWRENTWGANGQAIELPDDMSSQYNTQLTDEQEKQYTQWAKDEGRELDVQNYDLRGAWLEMQNNSSMSEDERGHLGDKYKKPNHPTFSAESIYNGKEGVQGGKWEQNGAIWSYTPGRKLTKDQAKRLEKYFQEHEAGNYLNLKDKVYKDPEMFVPGKTPGWFDGFTDVLWKPMLDAAFRFTSTGLMAASKGMFWVRDDFRDKMAKASEDLDEWTRANLGPDPQTMGTATQILYGLMNTLPELALFMTGAGAAARLAFGAASAGYKVRTAQLAIGSAMFGTDMGVAERNRLVNEGVDKDTAFWAGMASGITNTIGVAIPPFLGASRTMSAIYGGVSNVGINYAELKTIQYVLENQNYNELAQQYQLGLTDSIVSATLGAVMGAAFWRSPRDIQYDKARSKLLDKQTSYLRKAGFGKKEAAAQADINSSLVIALARVNNIEPKSIISDFAPKLEWSEDGKSVMVPGEYAMKMAESIEARYNEAVAKGDLKEAEALVKEYAKVRGYTIDDDYRDMHSAPKASVAKEDFANLDKLREAANESSDVNIFAIANDVSIVPSDFFTFDGWWQYSNRNETADNESFFKIRKAIDSIQRQTEKHGKVKYMPYVWVYRAVPKSVKEGNLQSDGQWVTPSREYARQHGQSRFGKGEYRIIKENVRADQLWFNGDSINEWGFDNGEKYVYKNTKNNRKRYDAIVKDDDGNIVPLSKRFNERKSEEFYQIKLGELLPFENKLAQESLSWRNFVFGLKQKPLGNVVMLKQLPLIFKLIGYKGEIEATGLRASPHLFDGVFSNEKKNSKGQNAHRNIDKTVIAQLPHAIAEPIAVYKRFGDDENSFLFMVDIRDKDGGTVIVPIGINLDEGFMKVNVVKTAYTKTRMIDGKPDNDWFRKRLTKPAHGGKNGEKELTAVYLDDEKLSRWNTSFGSASHSVLSNGLFGNVKKKSDLVKERENEGNKIYQKSQEGIRGSFNEKTNTIKLTPNANLSTFSHEHAHWYLSTVMQYAGKQGASMALQDQVLAICRVFGIKSLDEWNALSFKEQERYQEQFAAWAEIYLSEGKSPVSGLEGVFKKFGEWLVELYRNAIGDTKAKDAAQQEVGARYEAQFGEKLPELSPDVRKVLDKMYGAQEKFVPTKGQTAAARFVQATRVNADKINAPIENAAASPAVENRAAAIQGKAESDLNNGRKVDVSGEVGDLPENVPVVNEAQRTFGRAVSVGDGDQSRVVVLQNRDRSAPTSVAQMNSIAADPQYGRLSVSRTTQSGAPIVSFGQVPDQRFQGKNDVLTDSNGDKIPVTYYVVEADTVMRSNNVDGTPNPQWSEDHPESMRAVAGNGRMAGLNEAYNRGTAEKYREELIADEANHGVSADVIRGMKKPVLVRYMNPDNVTTGFIERSNTSDVLVRSALETAVQDSPKVRKNIDKYEFDENGDPTRETLGQFLTDVGETSEMGNLLGSDGQPTTTARNRIRAALFYEAYRDNRLTELVADSEDKQGMKRILNAMSAFAPRVIEIREASNGAIDLGPVITGAVNRILQARINGEGVDFSLQTDMFDSNPVTDIFSQFFSNNKNSTAAMLRVLRPFADDLQNRLKAADSPLFEEEAVKTDLADAIGLFRQAENNEIRAKSGNLLGDNPEGLLPDIDVAGLRDSIARTVQPATELVSSIAEGVRDTNVAATPEAKAARLNEHLAEQARAREVLGADSEAARARNMILEDADRVVTINDANGNPIQMRAADLLEHTKTMDQELENDVSGLGTGVACIIRNQGIRV